MDWHYDLKKLPEQAYEKWIDDVVSRAIKNINRGPRGLIEG